MIKPMAKKEGAPIGNQNARKPAEQLLNPVTIRLLDSQLDKLKAVAKSQKLPYNELIRRWIDSL
jgi:hypothetical protein